MQVGGGEDLNTSTVDARDVDAVLIAQAQGTELSPVDLGVGDDDALADELGVNRVPVDVGAVPVTALCTATEEALHLIDILGMYQDEEVVSLVENGL